MKTYLISFWTVNIIINGMSFNMPIRIRFYKNGLEILLFFIPLVYKWTDLNNYRCFGDISEFEFIKTKIQMCGRASDIYKIMSEE